LQVQTDVFILLVTCSSRLWDDIFSWTHPSEFYDDPAKRNETFGN